MLDRSKIRLDQLHIKEGITRRSCFPSSHTMTSSRFKLPPGPSYILHQLLSWKVIGYAVIISCIRVGGEILGMDLPLWAIISSSTVAFPALLYAQTEVQYWRDGRKAESLGARLAPKIPSKWPAGIDLVVTAINIFNTGYLGEFYDLNVVCVGI